MINHDYKLNFQIAIGYLIFGKFSNFQIRVEDRLNKIHFIKLLCAQFQEEPFLWLKL